MNVIVAYDKKTNGIGMNGTIPWHIPEDLKYFKEMTRGSVIIMGYKTALSINRVLKDRVSIVVSRNHPVDAIASSLEEALHIYNQKYKELPLFIIGGGELYKEVLDKNLAKNIYVTAIDNKEHEYDTFFPKIDNYKYRIKHWKSSNINGMERIMYEVIDKEFEENQYLSLIQDILVNGERRQDRTGTGTLSLFAPRQMKFSLRNNKFPLLTTKKVFLKGIIEELLWFLSGSTNSNILVEKGVNIWKPNTSKEFLKKVGLERYEEGDIGPLYSFQWRHYGAEYKGMHEDYTGKGFDQISWVINELKNNPYSRRLIVNAWNPSTMNDGVLCACHNMFQFYVSEPKGRGTKGSGTKKELSLQMYQRSGDVGLGVPFNIASYALLLKMVAHVVDMEPGDFIHVLGDAHIYLNHVEQMKEQLVREPYEFPSMKIVGDVKSIFDFKASDFVLEDYKCHPGIKMEMSA